MESTTDNVKYYEIWRDIMGHRPVLPPDKLVKINREEGAKEDYTTTIDNPVTKEDPEYFDLKYDDVTNANIVFDKILLPIAVSSVKLSYNRLADFQFSKYIKYLEKFKVIVVPVFNNAQLLEDGELGQSFISSSYNTVSTIINELGLSNKIAVVPYFVGEMEPRDAVSYLQSEVVGNDALVLNLTAIRRFYRIVARLGKLGIYGDMLLLKQIDIIIFSSSYTNMTPRQYMTDRIQTITELFETILDKYYMLKDGEVVDILRTVIMRLIDYVYMNAAYIDSMSPERYKKELLSKKKKFNIAARKFIANVKRYIGSLDSDNLISREEILTRLSDVENRMFESIEMIPDNGVPMHPLTRVLDSWAKKKSNRRGYRIKRGFIQ